MANVNGVPALVPAQRKPGPDGQWILSTTGDGTYTLVNVATRRLVEVGGQSTADGAPVDFWLANSGANQRWAVIDETVAGTGRVDVFTPVGVAPELPDRVPAIHPDGTRGTLPVTWNEPGPAAWRKAGTVTVRGTATDALGGRHPATARVTVDRLVSTQPARARTYVGGTPDLPDTVQARRRAHRRAGRPTGDVGGRTGGRLRPGRRGHPVRHRPTPATVAPSPPPSR